MLPKENEENVQYEHNKAGSPPSTFEDVEDPVLRTYNRGAVMANILERYIDRKLGAIPATDMSMCMREIGTYLGLLPAHQQDEAKASMIEHLKMRGLLDAYPIA